MDVEKPRTDVVRVRLAPEMFARLGEIASRYCLPPSTMAAFAVAKFVQNEENNLVLSQNAMQNATSEAMKLAMKDEDLDKTISSILSGMAKNGVLPFPEK